MIYTVVKYTYYKEKNVRIILSVSTIDNRIDYIYKTINKWYVL